MKPKDVQFQKGVQKDTKELTFSQNFLSYCYLKDENIVFGTDQGELLLFNSTFELKVTLKLTNDSRC